MISFALPIIAITAGAASAQSFTNPPTGTQFTLQGCRNTGQTPLYLNPGSTNADTDPLVCSADVYTTGNLQKGWNELDLVPYRLTVSPGDSGQFDFYIGADFSLVNPANCGAFDQGANLPCGYDVLTSPILSTHATNDISCKLVAVGPTSTAPGLTGGTSLTIVRQVTISGNKNASCNFD